MKTFKGEVRFKKRDLELVMLRSARSISRFSRISIGFILSVGVHLGALVSVYFRAVLWGTSMSESFEVLGFDYTTLSVDNLPEH